MLSTFVLAEETNSFILAEFICEDIIDRDFFVCGLDTETTVPTSYTPHVIRNNGLTSILQICIKGDLSKAVLAQLKSPRKYNIDKKDNYTCIIFPLTLYIRRDKKLPSKLVTLLKSSRLVKVGAAINLDAKSLGRSYGVSVEPYIDLQTIAKSLGINQYSLDDLASKYTDMEKAESQLGNYDGHLTEGQIHYSALDAYLSLSIYETMIFAAVPTKIESYPPLSSEECRRVYNFIVKQSSILDSKSPFISTRVVDVLTSSYGQWRKFPRDQIREYAQQILDWMVKNNYIRYSALTESYYTAHCKEVPVEIDQEDLFIYKVEISPELLEIGINLCRKNITENGVSRLSLINILENCMRKHLVDLTIDQRKIFISSLVNEIASQDIIIRSGAHGKYYLSHQ